MLDSKMRFMSMVVSTLLFAAPVGAQQKPQIKVARWEVHEFSATGRAQVSNPFRDASLIGEFTSPSGKTIVVQGFHDGDAQWRLRFAPSEEGTWSYLLRGENV